MTIMRKTILAFTILGTLALLAAPAQAKPSPPSETIIAAGPGNGGSQIGYGFNGNGWTVTDNTYGYIKVYLDPSAGPWQKFLSAPDSGFAVGQIYTLNEVGLRVFAGTGLITPAPPWTDYHESILTPGWKWYEADTAWTFTSNQPGLGATHLIDAAQLNTDWTFTPIAAIDTSMTITKYVMYVGGSGANPNAALVVGEYPTSQSSPEPSTIILLVVGAISALGYGWCRRRRAT